MSKIGNMSRALQVRIHHKLCMKWITDNHPEVRKSLWEESKAMVKALKDEEAVIPAPAITHWQPLTAPPEPTQEPKK